MTGHVTTSIASGIGTIEFGHPKGNALTGALLTQLATAITTLGQHPEARVIVLKSSGESTFCAGASFDEFTGITTVAQGKEFFSGFSRVVLAIIRAPKFVIARVQGKAAGGALGVIAACDYSVATNAAQAKLSELQVGIGPFVVGAVLERKLGLAPFQYMGVHADWHDAAWCERHGLYGAVVRDIPLLDALVQQHAERLAASNPEAMAEMKRIFWHSTEQWEQLLAERAALSGRMVLSDFTKSALAKFKAQ